MIDIRVFVAIEFEQKIKEYLCERQQAIKENSIKGNFTNKENFHVTLKFIGEVEPEEIENLKKAIDEVAVNQQTFTLSFQKIGQFSRGKKSIVWVGLKKNKDLEKLQNDLENSLEKEGYTKEERTFKAHITLGREVIFKCNFEELQKNVEIKHEKLLVNKVSLMESKRINGKLKYAPIYSRHFEI